jgi:hypothetical protein
MLYDFDLRYQKTLLLYDISMQHETTKTDTPLSIHLDNKKIIENIFYPRYKELKYELEQFRIESKQEQLESSIN